MGEWAVGYMSQAARAGGDADVTFVYCYITFVSLHLSIKLHLCTKMPGLFVLNCRKVKRQLYLHSCTIYMVDLQLYTAYLIHFKTDGFNIFLNMSLLTTNCLTFRTLQI